MGPGGLYPSLRVSRVFLTWEEDTTSFLLRNLKLQVYTDFQVGHFTYTILDSTSILPAATFPIA